MEQEDMTIEEWNKLRPNEKIALTLTWEEKETREIDSKVKTELDIAGSTYYSELSVKEILESVEKVKFLNIKLYWRSYDSAPGGGYFPSQYTYSSNEETINTTKIISLNENFNTLKDYD